MKRTFLLTLSVLLLFSCGQSQDEKDKALVGEFYEHVLGNKPMTDEYLQATLSDDILKDIWEADYDDTYSYWVFRTGLQDGPSAESSVQSIEPMGEGWYRVTYSDLGNPGVTEVQVKDGRICNYKAVKEEDTPIAAIERYMADTFGTQYSQGEYCIPYSHVLAVDDANPDEILVWGDFWVENFNLEGETLKNVSGGSHPGLMHVARNADAFEVKSFDAVADGSDFNPTAKAIFGERYDAFIAIYSDDQAKKATREEAIATYVSSHQIPAKYYQDFGWDAQEIPVK